MKQNNYHGIIINKQFFDESYPETLKVFNKKNDDEWIIYGIEVETSDLDRVIKEIQDNTIPNEPWYSHFYNDEELIVVFKNKVLKATPHNSTWKEIIEFGRTLNIPEHQLDFWPNRFQDEVHAF